MWLAIKTTNCFDSVRSLYFVLYKFVKTDVTLQSTSKRILKSCHKCLKLFDPAFCLLVAIQNIWKKKNSSKFRVFQILDITLEIPSISNST